MWVWLFLGCVVWVIIIAKLFVQCAVDIAFVVEWVILISKLARYVFMMVLVSLLGCVLVCCIGVGAGFFAGFLVGVGGLIIYHQ